MRQHFPPWAALALSCALLAGCTKWEATQTVTGVVTPGPNVQVDWSVLEEPEALPAVGGRWYEGYVPELIPSPDYGPLLPCRAALAMTQAWWEEEPGYTSPSWLYGLMTQDGILVMDGVCSSVSRSSYTLPERGSYRTCPLPVYALVKGDAELGSPATGDLVALAAEDGSWWTGFRFWGSIAYPDGIAAGDKDGLTLLDAYTGAQTGRYTWAELGISDGATIPWFTGDAPSTAQWTGERLFLGVFGENYDTARFLDPATGTVTTCSAQDWYNQWEEKYNAPAYQQAQWTAAAHEDGTITLTKGAGSHTFPNPLPQDEYPSVLQEDRVYFSVWGEEGSSFAVTDLEGNVIIPVQNGDLSILNGQPENDLLLFAIRGAEGWTIYDRDGKELYALPGELGSWCYLNGPLIEIVQENCAAYYSAETGDCIRRVYAGLEGREPDL